MSLHQNLRILIADDHALVREGVRKLVEEQPDMTVVADAGDGDRAVQLAVEHSPDVALVDVSMPGTGGVEATRLIRTMAPGVKVIALTRHDDPAFVARLFDAGALGYVPKQSMSPSSRERSGRLLRANGMSITPSVRACRAKSGHRKTTRDLSWMRP